MATITTKFAVGDVVYAASTHIERRQRPCPDCLGSKKWKAISPAGVEYDFSCPRCGSHYQSNDDLSLDYSVHAPSVQRLTVGQVRATDGHEPHVEYMCLETGIGSGTLWYENILYQSEADAQAAAVVLAAARDQEVGWVRKTFDKSLRLCDYEMSNAVKKAAEDHERARSIRVGILFDDLRDIQTVEEIEGAIERYSERAREMA